MCFGLDFSSGFVLGFGFNFVVGFHFVVLVIGFCVFGVEFEFGFWCWVLGRV